MPKNITGLQQDKSADKSSLRQGVGLMIINSSKEIFIGKRISFREGGGWQMPQGGIDQGETPTISALREMEEEIGTCCGQIIAESKKWYNYVLPQNLIPEFWQGKYTGQRQKWFLIKFTGKDSDININTADPEFVDWRWATPEEVLVNIISFKYDVYTQVIKEFSKLITD